MQPQHVDNEDYQFPLPVQDMNDEIIVQLDDDSLYQLCQTNKQMAKTCLSNNIWNLRANSPLAPFFIVRDQYKNWLDFYAHVRKDYLYYVNIGRIGGFVFTNIREALLQLLRIGSTYSINRITSEQLQSLIENPKYKTGKSGSITLVRKNVTYDKGNIGEYILYSFGKGDDFLNPDILTFPDLVNVPVMKLITKSEEGEEETLICVDFSAQALAESRSIPGIADSFRLSYNNINMISLSIGPIGWILAAILIVNGAVLNIEGISTDRYYIVSLPPRQNYKENMLFRELIEVGYKGTPESINNLRQHIITFGTFYNLEDIAAFFTKITLHVCQHATLTFNNR